MAEGVPALVELERGLDEMALRYEDGSEYKLDYLSLRLFCPCAGCSPKRDDEGRRVELEQHIVSLHREKPRVNTVGNYALSFEWSQGCNSGIYTFERLYKLAQGEDADDGKSYIHGAW